MLPTPLALGPIHITYYGLLVAAGVLAALALFSITAPCRKVPPHLARDFCFWMILAGLAGSRLAFVIFHWSEFSNPLEFLAYWRGGLMFQGGVAAALLISPIFIRRYGLQFWPTADVMAPSLALGQAFGRLGCLSAGCCYGRPAPAGQPFALIFPENSLAPAGLPLLPAQPLEALLLFLLAALLTIAIKKSKPAVRSTARPTPAANHRGHGDTLPRYGPGKVAGLYLLGAGLIRLAMELFLRGDYRGQALLFDLPPTTLTAIVSLILGLLICLRKKPGTGKIPG